MVKNIGPLRPNPHRTSNFSLLSAFVLPPRPQNHIKNSRNVRKRNFRRQAVHYGVRGVSVQNLTFWFQNVIALIFCATFDFLSDFWFLKFYSLISKIMFWFQILSLWFFCETFDFLSDLWFLKFYSLISLMKFDFKILSLWFFMWRLIS